MQQAAAISPLSPQMKTPPLTPPSLFGFSPQSKPWSPASVATKSDLVVTIGTSPAPPQTDRMIRMAAHSGAAMRPRSAPVPKDLKIGGSLTASSSQQSLPPALPKNKSGPIGINGRGIVPIVAPSAVGMQDMFWVGRPASAAANNGMRVSKKGMTGPSYNPNAPGHDPSESMEAITVLRGQMLNWASVSNVSYHYGTGSERVRGE